MSHNIEQFADGTAAFVSAREHAWHKLGTVVPEAMDLTAALELASLDQWDVRKAPLFARVPVQIVTKDGETTVHEEIPVPGKFSAVRTHPKTGEIEHLGIVGNTWTPAQNEEVAALLGYIVDETKGIVETAGSINDGRDVFISVKLPNTMRIGGKDPVDLYLVGVNNHAGTGGLHVLTTPVRVVCQNTLNAAMGDFESKLTIRHTTNMKDAMADARQKLDLAFEYCEAFEKEAQRLYEQELTVKRFENMAEKVLREQKSDGQKAAEHRAATIDTLRGLFLEAETNEGIHGTRWGAYNAFTEYFDHIRTVNAADEDAAIARAKRTLTNAGTIRRKNKAWELLTTAK
ncbi:DUF932 domain-containing protein [Streptomyces sp. NRRL S-350]|uniref:DUF932 domain-containing protein n=1 Tax=Streptomyces sp. NRRL S-350 TaxID=1463902 RepID=UPI0004C22C6A|nr:DUF932 domain-containing protein [Streptomyces sp. NRRL S-350]